MLHSDSSQDFNSEEFRADPTKWLQEHARPGMDVLLAHSDAGVIWGKVKDGQLILAGSVHPEVKVDLLGKTLQQVRLFGPTGEWFIWRTAEGFKARLIADSADTPADCLEDRQWLWGTRGDKGKETGDFTLLVEGRQGMRHAPPITGLGKQDRVALTLRHYIEYDPEGQAHIAGGRLTGLIAVRRSS